MKRYTGKSKIKRIKVKRDQKEETLFAEIIKEPSKNIPQKTQPEAIKEIRELATKGWGDFEKEYLEKSVLKVYLLCLLRDSKDNLIGIAPIKKLKIRGRKIYSFGLTVVDPIFRNFDLSKKMHFALGKEILIDNLKKARFKTEFVFITPNIRTLSTLSKISDFIYPNPYSIDPKTKKIKEADDETWKTIKGFLKVVGEKYRNLEREGCIMEGFYDEKPHLIYKEKLAHKDQKLNEFAKEYLYRKPGREIVARAIVNLKNLFRR